MYAGLYVGVRVEYLALSGELIRRSNRIMNVQEGKLRTQCSQRNVSVFKFPFPVLSILFFDVVFGT